MPPPKKKPDADVVPLKAAPPNGREVVYPELKVLVCVGDDALTPDLAKELLGWKETTDKSTAVTVDRDGKPVVFLNNIGNRPFYPALADGYAQEVLQRRWRLNGETMIIGKYGATISCQHRLAGLVLAEQDRVKDPAHWKKNWPGPVTMDTLIVQGVDEEDAVVNTLDTGKSRSDADVIYRGPWFADKPSKEREALSRAAGQAIKTIWVRSKLDEGAFGLRKSVTETTEFLNRHPRLVDAVKHLHTENSSGGTISAYVPVGQAAGMMYLMAAGQSDPAAWTKGGSHNERNLDLSDWDKAQTFWTLLGSHGSPDLRPLREAKSTYKGVDEDGKPCDHEVYTMAQESSRVWHLATVCKAWNEFVVGNKLTPTRCSIPLYVDENNVVRIKVGAWMTVGGVDLGGNPAGDALETSDESDTGVVTDEVVADVETRKEEVREEKAAKKSGPAPADDPLTALRKKYPDHVLFIKVPKEQAWTVVGKDVKVVQACGCQVQKPGKQGDGTVYTRMYPGVVDTNADKLVAKGHKVAKVFDKDTVKVVGETKKTKAQKADDDKVALAAAEDAKLAATKSNKKVPF